MATYLAAYKLHPSRTDYVTWNGPDPDLRKGTNQGMVKGPNASLRKGSSNLAVGANLALRKGPNKSLVQGSMNRFVGTMEDKPSPRGR